MTYLFDGPWKEVLDHLFPRMTAFLFPDVHSAVDWSIPLVSRDKELQRLSRQGYAERRRGVRYLDKLVEVRLRAGDPGLLLLHLECQNERDPDFPRRMFCYNGLIRERYQKPVLSLAVLGDGDPRWRPDHYRDTSLGYGSVFTFPVAKLLAFEARATARVPDPNPFALVVAAHLKALQTPGKKERSQRAADKVALLRAALNRHDDKHEIQALLTFIDWVLYLPDELDKTVDEALDILLEEGGMAHMMYRERKARDEGIALGRNEGIALGRRETLSRLLCRRFGTLPPWAESCIADAAPQELALMLDRILEQPTLEGVLHPNPAD